MTIDIIQSSSGPLNSVLKVVDGDLVVTADILMSDFFIKELANPIEEQDAATKLYVDAVAGGGGLYWQHAIEDFYDPTSGLPVGPSEGLRYTASATANGWIIHNTYEWDGSSWDETVAEEGYTAWYNAINVSWVFNGTIWVKYGATLDHNNLINTHQGVTTEDTPLFEGVDIISQLSIYNRVWTTNEHFSDDFNDNSIDLSKWNVTNATTPPGEILEQNQRIEMTPGDSTPSHTALITDDNFSQANIVELFFRVTPAADVNSFAGYTYDFYAGTNNGILIYFNTITNVIDTYILGADSPTGYSFVDGNTYNCRIKRTGSVWDFYVQSAEDATFNTEVLIATKTHSISSNPYIMLVASGSTPNTVFFNDVFLSDGVFDSAPAVLDGFVMYSSDSVTDNACPTFKTENETVIQLNQSLATNDTPKFDGLGIGTTSFGASATNTMSVLSGVAPAGSIADGFQMYSSDFSVGNACPHFRTEDGTVIGLNQSLFTTDIPTFVGVDVTGRYSAINAVWSDSIFEDDFNDNDLDLTKWVVTDTSAGDIREQNQRLEVLADFNSNTLGINTINSFTIIDGSQVIFNDVVINDTVSATNIGLDSVSPFAGIATSIVLRLGLSNNIETQVNGSKVDTGYNYIYGDKYNCRIVRNGADFEFYVQSDDDSNYTAETLVDSRTVTPSGNMYGTICSFNSNSAYNFIGDYKIVDSVDDNPPVIPDGFSLFAKDYTAGNACPTFRTEDGTVIQLNQDLSTSGTPAFNSVQFDVAHGLTPSHSPGLVYWNDLDGTLNMHTDISGTVLQIGQELYVRVVNKEGSDIYNGNIVIVSTAQGNRPGIVLAQANAEATSEGTLGYATHDIDDNQEGFITVHGLVRDINTTGIPFSETWNDGDVLFLSATTAGGITNVPPAAPNHTVVVGYVLNAHATQGLIYARVINGAELYELHDVHITSVADNDILQWNSSNSRWENISSPSFETAYITSGQNFGIGTSSFGGATNTISVLSGTAPTGSIADGFQMYSSDFVAGNAIPHFRTENGTVLKLNQSLATTDDVIFNRVTSNVELAIKEQVSAPSNIPDYGQIYCQSDNYLHYLDGDGVHHLLHGFPSYKSYTTSTQGLGFGATVYAAGYYDYSVADANLSYSGSAGSGTVLDSQTFGTTGVAYAAHSFIVAGGAGSATGGVVKLRVSGTSITDDATRTTSDTEDLLADITGASLDDYFEGKKWLGQITFELVVVSGTVTDASFDFNYGLVKYEDFGNNTFVVTDFEVLGLAGATDPNLQIALIHHKTTGWTYHATAFDPVNSANFICDMDTDHGTEDGIVNGSGFAYKRSGLSTSVDGADSEGVIAVVDTTVNNAVEFANIHIGIEY
ncbi:MAG: hypothetical protein KAS32_05850 [Candidatus Peribacteraceae bacterium]|nr:hypothetical protein [Candidatus Peribacteraceae bacterium]